MTSSVAQCQDARETRFLPSAFEVMPVETLAAVIEQGDCTKIALDGTVRYMTCRAAAAFEIENPDDAAGTPWAEIWPVEQRPIVESARLRASIGETVPFKASRDGPRGAVRWFEGTIFPVSNPDGTVRGLVAVTRDVTPDEMVRQALDTKTAEMRHRLRNTYAMIGSLVTSFSRGSPEREAFAEQMMERLAALGTAQALLVTSSVTSCRVKDLLPAIVAPFDTAQCPVTIDDLSDAELDQGQADAIALVLGELAVNSDKHGALGSKGAVEIDVACHDDTLEILWSERGGRLVEARSRPGGQGLRLMDRVARSMRGEFCIDWKANGLDARMTLAL
jgi:two-component sensor histidine kinase